MSPIGANQSPMTNVYNLLREACGISQVDAAEHVHDTRLDSVKSWCSGRRTAPQGVINELQKLARQIHNAGTSYAGMLKRDNEGDVYIIGLPKDEEDARVCGFPSVSAQMRAIAIAVSLLPDNAEIRMIERVRGAYPAPILEPEEVLPSEADIQTLASMKFTDDKYCTSGAIDRRRYERLEKIGWVHGDATNLSDVEYTLLEMGKAQLALLKAAYEMRNDLPDPAPQGMQTMVNSGMRRGPTIRLKEHQDYRLGDISFRVEAIDRSYATIKLSNGRTGMLYAPAILF